VSADSRSPWIWFYVTPGYITNGWTDSNEQVLGARQATVCPAFMDKNGPSTYYDPNNLANARNTLFHIGGTYAFSEHFDRSLMVDSTSLAMHRLDEVHRLSERAIFGDGAGKQGRYTADISGGPSDVLWFGHLSSSTNLTFGDGHAASMNEDTIPDVITWPSQSYGKDTTLPAPW
jgi:prepilin-type processing-associated H-X9-DG protein